MQLFVLEDKWAVPGRLLKGDALSKIVEHLTL
jgi:hypothetical protein